MRILRDLSCSLRTDLHTLKVAYDEWIAASPEERREFRDNRECTVRRYAGVYYDQAHDMRTSGSSCGLAKKYRWGPNYPDFWRFHHDVCFGDIGHDVVIHLNFTPGDRDELLVKESEFGGVPMYTVTAPRPDVQRERLLALASRGRRRLIWFLSSQVDLWLRRGFNLFEELDGVFHTTGEICTPQVKDYFSSRGLELRDTMRIWNGGASFFTCRYGGLHWNDFLAKIEIVDGYLLSSDHFNLAQYFWDYPTGDQVEVADLGPCRCGLTRQANTWADRDGWIEVEGKNLDYSHLMSQFGFAVAKNGRWPELLGANFGVGDDRIVVFFEFRDPVTRINDTGVAEEFRRLLGVGLRVELVYGLQYSFWKNRRVFRLD